MALGDKIMEYYFPDEVSDIAVNNGKIIAGTTYDDHPDVKVWDYKTGELLGEYTGGTEGPSVVALSKDGMIAATSDTKNDDIHVWDTETLETLVTFTQHSNGISDMKIIDNGSKIISASYDGTVKIWKIEDGSVILNFTKHASSVTAIDINKDDSKIVSADQDGVIKVWDSSDGTVLLDFTKHVGQVGAIKITPDGKKVVSGNREYDTDYCFRVWDIESGYQFLKINDFSERIYALDITLDGQYIIVGIRDSFYYIYNIKTGELVHEHNNGYNRINSIVVSPNGNEFFTAGYKGYRDATKVKRWELYNLDEDIFIRNQKSGVFYSTDENELYVPISIGEIRYEKKSDILDLEIVNKYPISIKNVEINPVNIPQGVTIELSKTKDPFNKNSSLLFSNPILADDKEVFYMQVNTDTDVALGEDIIGLKITGEFV